MSVTPPNELSKVCVAESAGVPESLCWSVLQEKGDEIS